ncbi:MAG: FGGY family carbohydrate kinase [Acidobacteria bacterium]|nr:FGGY family carbohydrate kinase [Acidobacteriota bacterium]
MTATYLGLDSSTQSLSAILIAVQDGHASVVWEHAIVFDDALPQYGTRHGVLPSEDSAVAMSSPQMWADAVERMFDALAASGQDLSRLRAISGSAQQHGSVYLAEDRSFSRAVSPIWMDSSTRDECDAITEALGGAQALAQRTGSRAFERFTGPQIRKFMETEPHAYAETARIHLVSSFLASRLLDADAPTEPGDASGMNLMDLTTRDWWPDAVEATAPGLIARLPRIVPADTIVGTLATEWQQRFHLPPASVVVWTGDNPSSLIGTGLIEEGRVAVSLGTSDTVFGLMREPRVDAGGTGHVFGAPTGDYMGITVFKNGSLARERVRDDYGLDWAGFSAALDTTPPGNHGRLMYPWFEPEITPDVPTAGVRRVDLDPADAAGNVRAVVEAQMMAMANHSRWMGVDVRAIHATGGAAVNAGILQVMADVFAVDVHRFTVANSACLGAALRAWHADAQASGQALSWHDVTRDLVRPAGAPLVPRPDAVDVYRDLRSRYADLERVCDTPRA